MTSGSTFPAHDGQPVDVLVLAAHPDDAELGCGGTLLRQTAAGRRVGVVDATRGEAGSRGTPQNRADDRWPRGHPWHGIALVSMGGFFAIQTRLHRGGLATRALALALPLCAMAAMAIALSATRAPA